MIDASAPQHRYTPELWDVEPPAAPQWNAERWAWIVSRHADVSSLLQSDACVCGDSSTHVRRIAERASLDATNLVFFMQTTLLMQNGERHRTSRTAVAAVMARLMARWTRPRLDTLASVLVASLHAGDDVDIIPPLVDKISRTVAADIFCIADRDIDPLIDWAFEISNIWRPTMPLREIARLEPIATAARETLERRPFPESDAGIDFFLLGASTATTSGTLAAALLLLARLPDLQQTLRNRSDLVDAFADETLRYAGAVRKLARRLTTTPVEIAGVAIPAGAPIVLDVERAGRDPVAYRDPNAIDLARDASQTLAFGAGPHACMGPRLARNQIAAAIVALLARYEISTAGEPTYGRGPDIRRFRSLPLRLESITIRGS